MTVEKLSNSPHPHRASETRRSGESPTAPDRKSTRLNSSHLVISYAVFCLKKKKHIVISLICKKRPSSDRADIKMHAQPGVAGGRYVHDTRDCAEPCRQIQPQYRYVADRSL